MVKAGNAVLKLFFIIFFVLVVLFGGIIIFAVYVPEQVFRLIFYFLALLTGLFLFAFVYIGAVILRRKSNQLSEVPSLVLKASSFFFFPVVLAVSQIFNYNKDSFRRKFIEVNNAVVLKMKCCFPPEKVLLLMPHCIQFSKCNIRLNQSIEHCEACGGCCVGEIKEIVEKHGISSTIATGGTAARNCIREIKPNFIIASACERDLTSGILDVKKIPVYGVVNTRPNGPCKDTCVNIEELNRIINIFVCKS